MLDIVRTRELERFGESLLADEWAKAKTNSGFLVANALENWTDMDWFAHRYINRKRFRCEGPEELKARVEQPMQDPTRQALIMAKIDEGRAYSLELDNLQDGNHIATSIDHHAKDSGPLATITERQMQPVHSSQTQTHKGRVLSMVLFILLRAGGGKRTRQVGEEGVLTQSLVRCYSRHAC